MANRQLSEYGVTTGLHSVLKQIARNEINSARPATRLAEVKTINTDDNSVGVTFVGESDVVRVPYLSDAPAVTGQYVRVGGTQSDRYVEAVLGQTQTDRRLEVTEGQLNILMGEVVGPDWEEQDDDTLLENIVEFFEGLGGGANPEDLMTLIQAFTNDPAGTAMEAAAQISLMFQSMFGMIPASRIPMITLAQLTSKPSPNLLEGSGSFGSSITLQGEGIWEWDSVEGHTSPGSARTTGDGAIKVLTSEAIEVAQGDDADVEMWVKWDSVTATGFAFQLQIQTYLNDAVVGVTVVSSISNPAATGAWTRIFGSYTVPSGVDEIRVRLVVQNGVTAGTVWFDDASLKKTHLTMPQEWITELIPDLEDLWAKLTAMLDQALAALGISPSLNILTKISDFADGIGDLLGGVNNNETNLQTFINNLFNNPSPYLGSLPQNKITNLPTDLGNLLGGINTNQTNLSTLINDLLNIPDTRLGSLPQTKIQDLGTTLAQKAAQDFVNFFKDAVGQGAEGGGVTTVGYTDPQIKELLGLMFGMARTAKTQSDTNQAQIENLETILYSRTTRPLWQGIDPTGEESFPVVLLSKTSGGSALYNVAPGNTESRGAYIRFEYDSTKESVSFIASYTTPKPSAWYIDVYRQAPGGTETLITSTGNIIDSIVNQAMTPVQITLPTPIPANSGDTYAVEHRISGSTSGMGKVAAIQMENLGLQGIFRPLKLGNYRTTQLVSSRTLAQADAAYNDYVPYCQLGSLTSIPPRRSYSDDFNRANTAVDDLGPSWLLFKSGSTGVGLHINNNTVKINGTQLVFLGAYAQYYKTLSESEFIIEIDAVSTVSQRMGVYGHGNSSGGRFVGMLINSSEVQIKGFPQGPVMNTDVLLASGGTGGNGHYIFTYDAPTKTYKAYKGATVATGTLICSWTDSSNTYTVGPGWNWTGMIFWLTGYNNSGTMDNFKARDKNYI